MPMVNRPKYNSRKQLTSDQRLELLAGVCYYPAARSYYTGYGDFKNTDAAAFITNQMKADWLANRDELLKFWESGECSVGFFENCKPWHFIYGSPNTLPWAAYQFDDECDVQPVRQ